MSDSLGQYTVNIPHVANSTHTTFRTIGWFIAGNSLWNSLFQWVIIIWFKYPPASFPSPFLFLTQYSEFDLISFGKRILLTHPVIPSQKHTHTHSHSHTHTTNLQAMHLGTTLKPYTHNSTQHACTHKHTGMHLNIPTHLHNLERTKTHKSDCLAIPVLSWMQLRRQEVSH